MNTNSEVRRVADEVLGRIVQGRYPSGIRLPAEVDLASELSCGRSTVREALGQLASLGVVRSRRGSGAMVLDFRRDGTPALLPWYILAGRFDRPVPTLARELLRVRGMLASEAVRLAARYASPGSVGEARRILAAAPALESDPVAHASNELDMFRSLVCSSGIWPTVWLANAFWGPLRELHGQLAAAIRVIPDDYQVQMTGLLDLIEARDEDGAERHLRRWLERVDAMLLGDLERVLTAAGAAAKATSDSDAGWERKAVAR